MDRGSARNALRPETGHELASQSLPGRPVRPPARRRVRVSFFKCCAGFFVSLGVLRARRNLAPSRTRQRTVDHRGMDRAAGGRFLGGLHRGHQQHAPGSGWFEKRSEQFLFWLACEVLLRTASRGFTSQDALALPQVGGMHLPYGADLPV